MLVAGVDRFNQLVDEALDPPLAQAVGLFLEYFQEVSINEFEDQIQLSLPAKGLLQLHNVAIRVPEHSEDLDLSQGCFPNYLAVVRLLKLLNRD